MRHESRVTIDAPAELVWRTIHTVEKWPEWTPTMREVRRLDDGDLRVGSSAEVRQPNQPKRVWTVTEVLPDRSFTWVANNLGVRLAAEHTVTEQDGRVGALLTFELTGLLAGVSGLFAGRTIRRLVDLEAASLKKWCEAHA
jgi:uncharacterized protein YndB with AHSA1/START domain